MYLSDVVRHCGEINTPFPRDFAGLPMPYPNILGSDLAGVIEEVGSGVTRLKKGDRVMA